jgi:hypothetical protein
MAELTGFEPAVSCVTGRHVGPLHHSSVKNTGTIITPCLFESNSYFRRYTDGDFIGLTTKRQYCTINL